MNLLLLLNVFSQMVGTQHDENGCSLDGGYQWCDTLNECIRPWIDTCPPEIEICSMSDPILCLNCPTPICLLTECALMIGNCCHYECIDGH